ncbi:Fungal peroxidase [Mycena kentingensis (nom. inval.)]|nr:Fungal peroxidase [Mycena kentingensis (nom. inval.)]
MAAIAAVVCPPRFSPERDMPDQSGRIALVTGGNSGVGYETVKQLLLKNATVYLAARSDERAPAAIAKLQTETDGKKAIFLKLDLGDIPSVRRAAEDFLAKEERLDYLFNNGGVMNSPPEMLTAFFGTNVIGHFFLTELLMPALLKSIVTTGVPARIIHTSSIGHNMVPDIGIDFPLVKPGPRRDAWAKTAGSLSVMGPWRLYGQSKLGNILTSNYFAKLHPHSVPLTTLYVAYELATILVVRVPYLIVVCMVFRPRQTSSWRRYLYEYSDYEAHVPHGFAIMKTLALFGVGLLAQHALVAADIFIAPAAIPALPSFNQANAAAVTAGLNLTNVQGDILYPPTVVGEVHDFHTPRIGMRKNKEQFIFFSILSPQIWKKQFKQILLPYITTTTQLINPSERPVAAVNIAFSARGLAKLGITDNLGDAAFATGMRARAELVPSPLGDPVPVTAAGRWRPEFSGGTIDGVVLISGDSDANIGGYVDIVVETFANCAKEVYSISGAARPGDQAGHERFDTASKGKAPFPGQAVVPPGQILFNNTGDAIIRPAWTKDGSFLAFRQLKQLVPEFNKFVNDNPLPVAGLTKKQQSDLFGARMVGRWKSGAPVFLSPLFDDPKLAADPTRNNNFNYTVNGAAQADPTDQSRCPFSAHIRKTRPRADQVGGDAVATAVHHIVRAGIPYGPEVTAAETSANKSSKDRGLAFVSYQSNLLAGFQFIQRAWANNFAFVHPATGFDPIIGANSSQPRPVNGLDPTNPNRTVTITTDFVVSEGGEYFFSPSIAALASSRFAA